MLFWYFLVLFLYPMSKHETMRSKSKHRYIIFHHFYSALVTVSILFIVFLLKNSFFMIMIHTCYLVNRLNLFPNLFLWKYNLFKYFFMLIVIQCWWLYCIFWCYSIIHMYTTVVSGSYCCHFRYNCSLILYCLSYFLLKGSVLVEFSFNLTDRRCWSLIHNYIK